MASRRLVPVRRIADLQRIARLAGEAFGYEDGLSPLHAPRSGRLWWYVAGLALISCVVALAAFGATAFVA